MCGVHRQSGDKASAWGTLRLLSSCSLSAVALTGVWLEAEAKRLLWRQHLLICQGSRWGCIEGKAPALSADMLHYMAAAGKECRGGVSKSRAPLVRFLCPLSNGFIISMTADPFRRLAARLPGCQADLWPRQSPTQVAEGLWADVH